MVKNAIILAAGYGMRMVPLSVEQPKALIKIQNEVLIERMIKQLHEANVFDIKIVVGFMKESFEYPILLTIFFVKTKPTKVARSA